MKNFDIAMGIVRITYKQNIAMTHSVVMRSSNGVIRFVDAAHRLDKSMIHISEDF